MDTIISPKKLIKIARKWPTRTAMGRKKLSNPRVVRNNLINSTSSYMVGEKGTFVIYTIDNIRFVLPLSYLSNYIFQELFKMSEEEFGLSSSGHIIFPCDSLFMNYVVLLPQRGIWRKLYYSTLPSEIAAQVPHYIKDKLANNYSFVVVTDE